MTNLLTLIKETQHEMIELAYKHGFTSEHTLECSQRLDTLLNLLMFEERAKARTSNSPEKLGVGAGRG